MATIKLLQMAHHYESAAAYSVRWNDPTFAIRWLNCSPTLSEMDTLCEDV